MFVTRDNNRQLALDFWRGKPSRNLIWALDCGQTMQAVSRQQGFEKVIDFYFKELGVMVWGNIMSPSAVSNPSVEIVETRDSEYTQKQYRHKVGVLTERLIDGQVIEHKVKTADDLKILRTMWETLEVTPQLDHFQSISDICVAEMPIIASSAGSSAVQQMLQYETGVAEFWYLAMDCPDLLEEVMSLYQDMMRRQYAVMKQVECDGFYQGENTSTTMISPEYYARWGVPQVSEFTSAAHAVNKRAMVHMCGLLKDLMPQFVDAGIDITHALTPPSIGDTPFEDAVKIMPSGFGMLGRFGSLEWIGKSQKEIEHNLQRILPHRIYQEHPFILLVTADGAKFTAEDLFHLRDAIAMYEKLLKLNT